MKKTQFLKITVALAGLAIMFASCQKKENDAAEKKAEVKQEKIIAPAEVKGIPFTMTYTGLWASPSFDVEDTWESIERLNQMADRKSVV